MLLQIPFLISSRIDYSCPIECPVSRAQQVEYPNVKQLRARGIPQDFHRIKRLIKIDPFVTKKLPHFGRTLQYKTILKVPPFKIKAVN